MAYEIPLQRITFPAGADLSTAQYLAGAMSGVNIVQATAGAAGGVGIIQEPMASGRPVNVMVAGVSMAVYGGTVTGGAALTADANGKLVVSTLSTDVIIGTALEAGSANEIHSVLLGARFNSNNVAYQTLSIPIQLAGITGAGTVAAVTSGFAGKIVSAQFVSTAVASTASKLATLGLSINTIAVTGGVISLTTAALTAMGASVSGTAITANNAFGATDTIKLVASSVTAFSEGSGFVLLTISK